MTSHSPARDPRPFPAALAAFARFVARLFFRHLEVVGADRVPASGPLLIVANHHNSLIDAVLVAGFVPRRPRFLAKATLWKHPVVAPFLRVGLVIPVHRRQDPGFEAARNEESFEAARAVLEAGGAVALFPEGKSHSEPRLAEIRTGAARIVLGLAVPARELVAIVPVGLHFDDKGRFRSGALIRFGDPVRLADLPEAARGDARALTDVIAEGLDSVTLSYSSVEDARRVERAVELVLLDPARGSKRPRLVDQVALRKQVLAAYQRLREAGSSELGLLELELDAWDLILQTLGVRDDELARAPLRPRRLTVLGLALRSTLELPLALVGAALHWPAYRACAAIAERVADEPDLPASYKLFGGLFLFPLTWLALGVTVGLALDSAWAGGGAALLVALLGWLAVRWLDQRQSLGGMLRAGRALGPRHRRERLLAKRAELRQRLLALAGVAGIVAEDRR